MFNNHIILKYAELILPILILIFTLICVTKKLIKILIKKTDNDFKIYKLPIYYIVLSIIPDIILIIGIFIGILIFIQCFYYIINDTINQIENILRFNDEIKIAFPLIIFGYIFHFGHNFLNLLLGPIIFKYCSSRIKNQFYKKIKLNSAINKNKFINDEDYIFAI